MKACEQVFIEFSIAKLRHSAERIRACLDLLDESQIWQRETDVSNSVANLCLHLAGNVRQWILHGVGGATDIRRRDEEFLARHSASKDEVWTHLHDAVQQACGTLERLPPEQLLRRVRPQNHEVTVLEAVYQVVEHFGEHTGQILASAKALTGRDLGLSGHLTGTAAPARPAAPETR